MSDLKKLQARIDSALTRLEGAARDLVTLEKENAQLRESLEAARSARQSDLEELDRLLEQLKPLIEERSDA